MLLTVPLSERSYDILIEPGALQNATLPLAGEAAVLSNATVGPLYADALAERLGENGRKILRFDVPDGEAYKSLEWTSRAYDFLARNQFSRRGAIVAVGGGVTGDWAGFVAATWMRGIDFVQVPTTLLAMVDSSVGGKTGVNHPNAKNLIGAFWQPKFVLIDPLCLKTLPPRELRAGLAEVIKYGVIFDAEFFQFLEENLDAALNLDAEVLQQIIARSCEIKAQVVGEDERESDAIGRRAILNYGHTAGHAFEAVSHYGELLHGEAISIGMTAAARLAMQLGTISQNEGHDLIKRQTRLFERANLPTEAPDGSNFQKLWAAMALDKKTRGSSVNFILPTRIGEVKCVENVEASQVERAIFG